ncbi:hypothetical protein NUACC26_068680 [Scytonema sp. NUACC26]
MVTTVTPAETRTLLENISWQTFKSILADMGSERNTRLAYDNRIVEIMSPLVLTQIFTTQHLSPEAIASALFN